MMALGGYGIRSLNNYATIVVAKIKLHKCGTKVQIQTPMDPLGRINCNIAQVRRPSKMDENLMQNEKVFMAMTAEENKMFPVFVKDQLMLLPKDMQFYHQDVFKAIFHTKNIVTTGENDDIIIE